MDEACARIGELGNLLPVKIAELSSQTDRPVSFTNTLGGRKAFLGRRGRRSWKAELSTADPADLAHVEWWARHQDQPLVFYPPGAVVTNALDPDTAGLAPERISLNAIAGPMVTLEGRALKSAVAGGRTISMPLQQGALRPMAIVPGMPVTLSGWLEGVCHIAIIWRDVNGAAVETDSQPVGTYSRLTRVHRTVYPPPGALQFTFQFFCNRLAGPAITFTNDLRPWQTGAGSTSVVVHGMSQQFNHIASDGVPDKIIQFDVTEVG